MDYVEAMSQKLHLIYLMGGRPSGTWIIIYCHVGDQSAKIPTLKLGTLTLDDGVPSSTLACWATVPISLPHQGLVRTTCTSVYRELVGAQ